MNNDMEQLEEQEATEEATSEVVRTFEPDIAALERFLEALGPKEYVWSVGRRKTAIARVRLKKGTGRITVNKRPFQDFFVRERDRLEIYAPLQLTRTVNKVDVLVRVLGGGSTGQAGAAKLGVARALAKINEGFAFALRERGYLTRDARKKERKKYGRRGARRSFQFSKR